MRVPGGRTPRCCTAAWRALAALPVADREPLLLVADGLSHQEAAQALGVPLGTLSSRLARARRKLRAELGDVNPDGERQVQGNE
jgi:DNA-directed RNA polymerase specialized sigma24 family protein